MTSFLIVGSGLTGATIARLLHDQGHQVKVVEARDHVGGNVHDHEQHGIRVHTYGPHYFRTNNERIWEWASQYTAWWLYEPCLQSEVNGEHWPWPPTAEVIHRFAPHPTYHTGPVRSFEDACLTDMPRPVYKAFVEGYTRKQWGRNPKDLTPDLAVRVDVRTTDLRLKSHRYQGIPLHGYTAWLERILDGIPIELNTQWQPEKSKSHVVYTGPLDAYHQHKYGHLTYRSQHRTHYWLPDVDTYQPVGQVNQPNPAVPYIRTLEWKHMMPNPPEHGTVITTETPTDGGYEYPYPDKLNAELADRYRALTTPGTTITGRLGEYRYYDMDQAIGRAHRTAQQLAKQGDRP